MSYLLHIDVSPMGEGSYSKRVANSFVAAYKTAHGDHTVLLKDLNANPIPHLDGEAIFAGYVPAENRPESQKKHQLRLDLIQEIADSHAVLISTPMWNWNIPSVLKAWIDMIVIPGISDPYGNKKFTGKSVTIVVASGEL